MAYSRPPGEGARARRRGLFGPPPKLTRSSPLTGRLLWHIGDWGRASEHIGQRWEELAGPLARERLRDQGHLVVLAATPDLLAAVLGSGLAHADALRAWRSEDRLALEPLDFKWSLETASARQVSRDTLGRLLALELPAVSLALQEARTVLGLDDSAPLEPHDGRFVAPEHPANQAALQAEPDLPSVLLPVDPQTFFSALPGWPAARSLARLENTDLERLRYIEAVERYYRLGAGVTGALTRLHTGLFDTEPPAIDPAALIEDLRRNGRAPNLNTLLLRLQHQLTERRSLDERLAQLPRTAYPFGRLRADLARLGISRSILDNRGTLGRAYSEIMREVSAAIRAAGKELVDSGLSAEGALERIAADPAPWTRLASAHAHVIAKRLKGRGQVAATSRSSSSRRQ